MPSSYRYEPDEWVPDAPKITEPAQLARVRTDLETRGPVLLKHWHYRGSRSPTLHVFDDYEDFTGRTVAVDLLDPRARRRERERAGR